MATRKASDPPAEPTPPPAPPVAPPAPPVAPPAPPVAPTTPAASEPVAASAHAGALPPNYPPPYVPAAHARPPQPPRSYLHAWLYSLFLGFFGGDRFYLGKIWTGILKLVTLGGFGLWWAIDLVLTILGAQTDDQRRPLVDYERWRKASWIITGIAVGILVLLAVTRPMMGWGMHGGFGGWNGDRPGR